MEYNDFVLIPNDEIIKMAKEYNLRLSLSKNKDFLPYNILDILLKTKKYTLNVKIKKLNNIILDIKNIFDISENKENKNIIVYNFCDGIKKTISNIITYIKQYDNLDLTEVNNYKTLQKLLTVIDELIELLGVCKYRK